MSTKLDFQLKLLVYQKELELSFFINVAKATKRSFFLLFLYSICHQVQCHLHLDKTIVHFDNHAMCIVLPLCGVFAILKNKKVLLLFHCKSSNVVLSIYIRTFFTSKLRKMKRKDKEIKK